MFYSSKLFNCVDMLPVNFQFFRISHIDLVQSYKLELLLGHLVLEQLRLVQDRGGE